MIGMILCGGHGKRFGSAGVGVPKSLLEIKDNYTILDRQLFYYKNSGIDRVILLTGYLGEKIEERCGRLYKGLKLSYVREEVPLGTLNAIRLGMEAAGEDVMVSNGDVVADVNLRRMREKFERSKYAASIFVVRMRSPYGIVELGRGHVKSFKEKPLLNYFINGGFYCLSRDVLGVLEEFKTGDIERTAFPRLAASGQLAYYKEEVPFWASIETQKDLEEVRDEYVNRTDKPWGFEKMLKLTEERMEKHLYIMAGYRTSLHYHEVREETLHIVYGTGYVELEGRRAKFRKGSAIPIKPGVPHAIVAVENTLIHEISTPHPEDVVRVRDFYELR